jgi:hypothetical protein
MNTISKWTMALTLLSGAVYGQVPSTNDTSDGNENTGMGTGALGGPAGLNNGFSNTASGFEALFSNTTGNFNIVTGAYALQYNTAGYENAATGAYALQYNTTGYENAATGAYALQYNTTGGENTATGAYALQHNTTGGENTATGLNALRFNTTGNNNTATARDALRFNTTGNNNTASGFQALYATTTGGNNTASGYQALYSNTTAIGNTAFGVQALVNTTTGSGNIAIGVSSGYFLTTGVNNIFIGAEGSGDTNESNTIRLGTQNAQTQAWIAGITTSKISGSAVYVTPWGQLGVLASSERYKTAIAPMGSNTEKLQQLRPVSFHLKTDPNGAVQYGLIAEEVAKVYPELVIRDERGRIDGVRYDELAPMLLNEVQKQQRINAAQADQNNAQAAKIASLEQQLTGIQAALVKLQSKDQLVAQR